MNLKDLQYLNPGSGARSPCIGGTLDSALQKAVPFRVHPAFARSSRSQLSKVNLESMEFDLRQLEQVAPPKKSTAFIGKASRSGDRSPARPLSRCDQPVPSLPGRSVIFFLVHGLEATSLDMRHVRAAILANIPNAMVYIIQNNTKLTNDPIEAQGRRLAREVVELLKSHDVSGRAE